MIIRLPAVVYCLYLDELERVGGRRRCAAAAPVLMHDPGVRDTAAATVLPVTRVPKAEAIVILHAAVRTHDGSWNVPQ